MKEHKDLYILVEFGGTRKVILREKLSKARETEAYMQKMARKAGKSPEEIKQHFTLRIVEE